jgi:hypothetical protein
MKCIIAGGRNIRDYNYVLEAIEKSGWEDQISLVISGTARGVDKMGEFWADKNGIPVRRFKPNYMAYGSPAALHIRNGAMAEVADALILIWDGKSKGSASMLEKAQAKELKVYQHLVEGIKE